MTVTNQSDSDKALVAAKKAKQMSPSVQYAIVKIMPNILNGAFWGFTDMKGIQSHYDAIRNSGGQITARKLGNACLIEANPNFLASAIHTIDPNALTKKDLETMQTKRAESSVAFEKFLISKGKSSAKSGNLFGGTIGIYCTNDVSTISYRGTSYPAFRVDINTVLQLLRKYGYYIKIKDQFVSAEQAYGAGENLWGSMILSPTKTGVFIDIKCTYNAEQIKMLEKQWKEQNGIK